MTTGKFYIEKKRLPYEEVVNGSITANWETAEANILSIGSVGKMYRLHSLILDISGFIGTATVRLYIPVNGIERQTYSQIFSVAIDGPGLWIVNGTIGIHDILRATAASDNAGDNGRSIGYTYLFERL